MCIRDRVTHSYIRSFFADSDTAVSTARAGNVIGGGDFASDRIIPDCYRSAVIKPVSYTHLDVYKRQIINLKKKVDAGCEFLTTQMFFDNNIFFNFLYRVREQGISVPVIPGIMPITRAKQVETARDLSGCSMPQRFLNLVDRFGSNPKAMEQAGIAYATDQIIDPVSYTHLETDICSIIAMRQNTPYRGKRN